MRTWSCLVLGLESKSGLELPSPEKTLPPRGKGAGQSGEGAASPCCSEVQRGSVQSQQVGWATALGPSLPSSHKRVDECAGLPGSGPKTSPNS